MTIPGYSDYRYAKERVHRIKDGKEMPLYSGAKSKSFYKLKRDDDGYNQVTTIMIKRLLNIVDIEVPSSAVKVNFKTKNDIYIDTTGDVYVKPTRTHRGWVFAHNIDSKGYPYTTIDGKIKRIHNLVAEHFIDKDYLSKGLVCLHKDNNKLNCDLSNLRIGTYSENNRDAYSDGLIPSKSGSIEHGKKSSVRYDWESIDLESLIDKHDGVNEKIAKEIGCSGNAVKKRRLKMGI